MTHTIVVVEFPWPRWLPEKHTTEGEKRPTKVFYGNGLLDGLSESVADEIRILCAPSVDRVCEWLLSRGYREEPCTLEHAMERIDDLVNVFESNGKVVIRRMIQVYPDEQD